MKCNSSTNYSLLLFVVMRAFINWGLSLPGTVQSYRKKKLPTLIVETMQQKVTKQSTGMGKEGCG